MNHPIQELLSSRLSVLIDAFADKTGVCVVRDRLSHPGGDDVVTLAIPGYRQVESFTCGFVAGLMVLHAFHPYASIDRFYHAVRPHRRYGASTRKIADALRQSGVGVSIRHDLDFPRIRSHIDQGFPIIACVRTNEPDVHHWVVIYGYGNRPNRVYLAANGLPYFARREYSFAEFSKMSVPRKFGLVCWGK